MSHGHGKTMPGFFPHSPRDKEAQVESLVAEDEFPSASLDGTEVVRRFAVANLNVVKISFPRTTPQGSALERDMHSGQQFAPLLELELGAGLVPKPPLKPGTSCNAANKFH